MINLTLIGENIYFDRQNNLTIGPNQASFYGNNFGSHPSYIKLIISKTQRILEAQLNNSSFTIENNNYTIYNLNQTR